MRQSAKRCRTVQLTGVALTTILLQAAPAFAEDDASLTTISQASDASEGEGLGDIIVTAQKRAQVLTDVGLSVAVVSGEALVTRQIATTEDLASLVPGLSVGNSGFSTPIYSLRGVGVNELSVSSGSSVAIYVDEVPLTLPVMTRGAALDLERLEVLKGPQGTLYGQNATGGAINYIARKPTDTFEAGLRGSYGRFNSTSLEGYISGPLGATLKGRIAARMDRQFDGWQKSVSRPGDTIGEINRFTGRMILEWEPSETLRFTLNVNGWVDKSDPLMPQVVQWVGQTGTGADTGVLQQVTHAPSILAPAGRADARVRAIPDSPRWSDWDGSRKLGNNDNFWQASLRADYDLTDQTQLTSITSYMKTKVDSDGDLDGIGTSLFPATLGRDVVHTGYFIKSRTKSFVQEVRATSTFGKLNWIVGANYQNEEVNDVQTLIATDFFLLNTLGGLGFNGASYDPFQKIKGWSVFTNADFKISDQFSISGGIRYSEEKRDFVGCTRDTGDGLAALTFNTLYRIAGTPNAIQPGGCYSVNAPARPGITELQLKENNVPWNLSVNFNPVPRSLIYARVSKGFKSGNFPTISATSSAQFLPVKQESVMAYEAGFKVGMLRWLTAEGALFYYDYKNKQQRGRENTGPPFNLVAKQVNIPKSTLKGAEIAVTLRPAPGLSISASEVYVKTKIKEYCGFNIDGQQIIIGGCAPIAAAPAPISIDGAPLPFVPKHSVNIDINYETPVGETLKAFIGGNMAYRSGTSAQIAANSRWDIGSYTLFEAQLGVADQDDRWRVWVWGKNLGNKVYWNNVVKNGEVAVRYVGMPRTFGISASYKFD